MSNTNALVIHNVCAIASTFVSGGKIFFTFTMTLTTSKIDSSFNALRKRKQRSVSNMRIKVPRRYLSIL